LASAITCLLLRVDEAGECRAGQSTCRVQSYFAPLGEELLAASTRAGATDEFLTVP
jgi:hypothetical protein